MEKYNFTEVEKKWQDKWEEECTYKTKDDINLKKFYTLIEFPYPSGEGLHVGHVKGQTAVDIFARFKRMQGYNVLNPMGYDAFGLPAENFAIKNKKHPAEFTQKNIDNFIKQTKSFGPSFDWSKKIDTTDPDYYKWTQWIFIQLFNKGLAYEKESPINWCPSCKTGLANEEVIGGKCERCDSQVVQKNMKQWFLKITEYAERLINDLDGLNWPEYIKTSQKNWIGKSEGCEFVMKKSDDESKQISTYTTRVDTVFGMTYVVIAPDFKGVYDFITPENKQNCESYIEESKKKSDMDRTELAKEKTGVFTGSYVINPFNNKEIPVYIGDYVLGNYGTGAVMAVPAHDERDFEFAKKYNIEIIKSIESQKSFVVVITRSLGKEFYEEVGKFAQIIKGSSTWEGLTLVYTEEIDKVFDLAEKYFIDGPWYIHSEGPIKKVLLYSKDGINKIFNWNVESEYNEAYNFGLEIGISKEQLDFRDVYAAFTEDGVAINSEQFSGLTSEEAREKMTDWLEEKGIGSKKINYKLRDWLFSRQRYWGEPIPIIKCEKCGNVPLELKDLPLLLPEVENYEPTGTGESPLASIESWVNTKCPKCGGDAKRETDTMPQWAGSSWYFIRYIDPKNNDKIGDPDKLKNFMPVDIYFGGAEHTTVHLLYSRFWNKALYDLGIVPTSEPYTRRVQHGLISGEDGRKMSKRWGNVINPDDVIKEFGADAMRTYIMFMGPYGDSGIWSTNTINGVFRFINRVWALQEKGVEEMEDNKETLNLLHKTIKKVSENIEQVSYHTALSQLMILVNHMYTKEKVSKNVYEILLKLFAPFAPHITEEIWENLGNKNSIHLESWPSYDEKLIVDEEITVVIQINGKVRDEVKVSPDIAEDEIKKMSLERENIKKWIEGKEIKKVIYVKGKLVSVVI